MNQTKDRRVWVAPIEKETVMNPFYRRVVYTASKTGPQIVYMRLQPMQEIGWEVHEETDQFFRFESGSGSLEWSVAEHGQRRHVIKIDAGDGVLVPRGFWHNIKNTSPNKSMMLYTIYYPSHHPDGLIQKTKPVEEQFADDDRDSKFERCVRSVKDRQSSFCKAHKYSRKHGCSNPWAICNASVRK